MSEIPIARPPSAGSLRALVVGAAGGAGQAFAESLLRLGVEVIAADQDEVGLARLRQDLRCATVPIDALDDKAVAAVLDHLSADIGPIDLLINVAGRGYVRTLAMMRVSRAFAQSARERPAYVINVAAPAGPDDDMVSYAGSEVAFDRLSQGLSDLMASPLLRILTLHRLDSPAAFADISERVCADLRAATVIDPAGAPGQGIR